MDALRAHAQPTDPPDRPRRAPGVQANEAHGRVVLVRPGDDGFQLLDELGSFIWGLCDGRRTLEDVIAAVASESDQTPSAVAGDVREWISELRTEEFLLAPAPGPAAAQKDGTAS
jgi:hypothetical protein